MKKTSLLICLLFVIGCAASYPPPVKAQQQQPTIQRQQQAADKLDLQRMELRALLAEIQVMRQQLDAKIQRARELQALIQAEEMKGEKAK